MNKGDTPIRNDETQFNCSYLILVLKYGRCRINLYDILAWKNCKI